MRATQIVAMVIGVAVVIAAVAVLTGNLTGPGQPKGNLLGNGGFESGNLNYWNGGSLLPSVETTTVQNGTHALRFQTTPNGNSLAQCTQQAIACNTVNSSTISQDVSGLPLSPNSTVSIGVYPDFQAPSTFQMTLDIAPASLGSPSVTLYYIFAASPAQCATYSQLVVNGSSYSRAFCLSPPQGAWTTISRTLFEDLPTTLKPTYLGSSLTLSLSFAGGNASDTIYVDSVSLRQ